MRLVTVLAVLLVLSCHTEQVEGVVSPLDLVTRELQDMKDTVTSVQASLITSVSLIQGNNPCSSKLIFQSNLFIRELLLS